MTETSVRRTITVPVPPATAFEVFTDRLGDFKPPEHNLLAVPIAETILEPRVGGSIIDRGTDGSECRWARILVFDRPDLLVFSWDIGPTWQIETDPARTSEVEVRFIADGDASTRVELEHRHLDRHGPGWESVRDGIANDTGWPLYLDRYAGLVPAEASNPSSTADSPLDMATRERAELADYLATLTPQQWAAPSLCDGWSVKDVVAHMVSYDELGIRGLIGRFAKGRFVYANDVGVREYSALPDAELLEFLRSHTRPKGLTAGLGGMIGLVDGTIHHQDIRRALGHPRNIPLDRLAVIVPSIPSNPRLGARKRIRGLTLRATDIDWTHGSGPEITGPGEALMMSMSGRPEAIEDLDGSGVPILAARQPRKRR